MLLYVVKENMDNIAEKSFYPPARIYFCSVLVAPDAFIAVAEGNPHDLSGEELLEN